ncbi:hypothetical protein EMIT051CA3_50443 [Pseudomonas chlororaphis]
MLGVVHRPLADRAFPHSGVHLAARAVVVVEHGLLGVALEDFFLGGAVPLGRSVGLIEVDDVLDAHAGIPPWLRCEWLESPKSMFIKMNIAMAFARPLSNILKLRVPLV